jgi:elongator complex protein 6
MAQVAIRDLQFFSDGGLCGGSKSLNLVTSNIDVSPLWLVDVVASRSRTERSEAQTLLITFQNRTNLHERGLKRHGSDMSIIKKQELSVLDLSQDLFTPRPTGFQPTSLDQLLTKIKSAIVSTGPTIILEHPEFLLSSGSCSALDLAKFIHNVHSFSDCLYLFCNSDEPLIEVDTTLGEEYSTFLTQIAHQSSIIVSLRPLNTGRADDVTGVLRISNGPRVILSHQVTEAEYLYLVSGDTVKLFYR